MGGRDHSTECETCGQFRGGLNDLRCDCDPVALPEALLFALTNDGEELLDRMRTLASNLAIAAFGAAMFKAGDNFGFHMGQEEYGQCTCQWSPNIHGEPYRGSTRCEQDSDDDADEAWQRWFDEECGEPDDPMPDGREGGGR